MSDAPHTSIHLLTPAFLERQIDGHMLRLQVQSETYVVRGNRDTAVDALLAVCFDNATTNSEALDEIDKAIATLTALRAEIAP